MPPPTCYPAEVSAAVDRSVPALSARAALDAYAANPHLRSSPTFAFLHFAVVGTYAVDELNVDMLEIDDDMINEEHFDDCPWGVYDVDLEDANGKIFRTRILHNQGNADDAQGDFGKVYDRDDDMSVLACIEGSEGDGITTWIALEGVAASFAEHAHLGELPSLLEDTMEPGNIDCQFTALLRLALYSAQESTGVTGSTPSALALMQRMFLALAKPGSVAHAENTVVKKVLWSDGLLLDRICTFACGRYPILVGEPSNARTEKGVGVLDWLLNEILPLMQAVRYHRAGDATKAMAAFGEWGGGSDGLWNEDFTECDDENVDECMALAEKFSFGLADDETFWSWVARHSPLARESTWFKQETIVELVELVNDVQDTQKGKEGGNEEPEAKRARI